MRVLFTFLCVAGVVGIVARESSAQDFASGPVRISVDNGPGMEPAVRCIGILHHGGLPGRGLGCGCENGNCACQGSYKYPVPPQSTYFWPGIYSQQTMTQYISPWRYPGLKPIPEKWKAEALEDASPFSGYRY